MSWIQTNSGKKFNYTTNLRQLLKQISLEDIAHSLHYQCRFIGHTNARISILQHSFAVAALCPEHRKQALLHDAAEAYIGDIPTPLKKFLGAEYRELEDAIHSAICIYFEISPEIPAAVCRADKIALMYEKKNSFSKTLSWGYEQEYTPTKEQEQILARFYKTSYIKPIDLIRELSQCR